MNLEKGFLLFVPEFEVMYCEESKCSRCEYLFCQFPKARVCMCVRACFQYSPPTFLPPFIIHFSFAQSCNFMTFHSMCWLLVLFFSILPFFVTCHICCEKTETKKQRNNSNSIPHPPFPQQTEVIQLDFFAYTLHIFHVQRTYHMCQPYPKQHIFLAKLALVFHVQNLAINALFCDIWYMYTSYVIVEIFLFKKSCLKKIVI